MMSDKLEALLRQMEQSGDSQKLAVADCLRTIASNGDGQDTDAFIACCADEIGRAAMELRNQLCGIYTEDVRDQHYEDWMGDVGSGGTHRGFSDWVYKRLTDDETDDDEEGDVGDTAS